jgi:hypothetical protein
MSQEETTFWEIMHEYVLRNFGYSVVGLSPDSGGKFYILRLNRHETSEHTPKIYTVFTDQLRDCVMTGRIPEGLLRDFPVDLK